MNTKDNKTIYIAQAAVIAAIYTVLTLIAAGFDLASGAIQLLRGAYHPAVLYVSRCSRTDAGLPDQQHSDGLCAAGYHFRNSGDLHRRDRLLCSSQKSFSLLRPSCHFQCADHSFRSLLRLPYPRRHSLFHADRRGRRSDLLHVIGTAPSERSAAFPKQALHTAGIMEMIPDPY